MKKILLIAALGLVAACAEEPPVYEPTPTSYSPSPTPTPTYTPPTQVYSPPEPYACDRSNYAAGSAGDADYANCVIQS